jgi:hypothetical protein
MRTIIADMTIEKLNADRYEFLAKAKGLIDSELRKIGLYLINININITDICDEAGYIVALGKKDQAKAINKANVEISLGYETAYVGVNHKGEDSFVEIPLKQSSFTLKEVTIQARSVIQKADRMLVLPSETQVKTSTGGIDLLQKMQLPRIFIDPVSEDISTTGNGEVQLRINGVQITKPEITALRPTDILRIEYHDTVR